MSINLTRAMKNWSLLLLTLSTIALCNSAAANTMDNISFATLPGDRFEVRMQFTEPPPEPAHYSIESPARIVFDFPNVDSAVARSHPLAMPNASSAMVATDGQSTRTRLILNLNELVSYRSWAEGNTYVVDVGTPANATASVAATTAPSTGATSSPVAPVAAAAQQSSAQVAPQSNAANTQTQRRTFGNNNNVVTNIDFRRGQEGDGQVIINLGNPNINIDMDLVRGAIELVFEGVQLPDSLRNRLDVTDFATPVNFISADSERGGTIIRVEAAGEYDYLAYQTDTEYVLSVKPLTRQEQEERERRFAYTGEKISMTFQSIEIKAALQLIADFQDFNLVTSDTVTGSIALRLNNVPWDQALDVVLTSKGLDSRLEGNVLIVKPAAELAEQERQELETKRQLQELAPLRTENIRVSYANAKAIYDLFEDLKDAANGSGLLSERGRVIVDERTNTIILTDTDEKIAQFRDIIDQLDVPIRQVLIEARIIIANTDFREELGVRWAADAAQISDNGRRKFEATGTLEGLVNADGCGPECLFVDGDGDGITDDERNLLNSTVVDLGVASSVGNFAWNVITDSFLLGLELSALEDVGQAEILSQPKVITGDKQPAFIKQGREIPYQEATASGATSTSFKEAVLNLEVTPQITPDNQIIMDLIINQDSVGDVDSASDIPILDITRLETQVLVGNGDTVVLGGIYQNETVNGTTKVPFLGDIPYVGRLFRNDIQRESKRELLIFITPRILADTNIR